MSAQPGEPTPNAFVFPPFAPPVFRAPPAAPAPAAAPAEEPMADDFAMEVPLPAHDIGDPDTDLPQQGFDADEAGSQPWEGAAPPVAEDLPWLEMPAGGSRVHTTDALPADDEMAGWAGWSPDEARSVPAADPAPDFAYDFVPPAADESSAFVAPEVDEPMPWAAPAPAQSSWEDILAPAEEASAAEQALSTEVQPGTGLAAESIAPPAESEAALEYEAAGLASELPSHDEFGAASAAGGYAEVADRLEGIARELRADPSGFLAGGSRDPLGLLVTGFVLGYGQGQRQR